MSDDLGFEILNHIVEVHGRQTSSTRFRRSAAASRPATIRLRTDKAAY